MKEPTQFSVSKTYLLLSLIVTISISGCATFNPRPIGEVPFQERAQKQYQNNVRVTASVLSAKETKELFDLDLYKKGIQPIWLEIENNSEKRVWFPPVGVDPDYFAPLEVAYMHHFTFSKEVNQRMDQYFHEEAFGGSIAPGSVRSGFVFTNLDLGTKNFNVDLVGEDQQLRTFTFFIPVPGLRVDHRQVDWQSLYSKDEIVSYDEEGLKAALQSLPCCTTNKDGTRQGDPLNVVIIGHGEDVHHAVIRSGWNETGALDSPSEAKTGTTSLSVYQSRYTPVSPLYFYGRPQDAAFRKARKTADERNELRLWLTPMRFEGKPVWIGQIDREIGVQSPSKKAPKIDLDEPRFYLTQDLFYSQSVEKFAYVKGVGAASMSEPRKNLKGYTYFTDGHRVVLWVSRDFISFSEVEHVEWEIPPQR